MWPKKLIFYKKNRALDIRMVEVVEVNLVLGHVDVEGGRGQGWPGLEQEQKGQTMAGH